MKHAIYVEKFGVRIRPVELSDAAFIIALRNSPHAIGRIGDTSADESIQERWIQKYFDRENDYYFIVETTGNGKRVGTVGVYDITNGVGEWGRWIIAAGVGAGPASAWLAFHTAFDILRLEQVVGHVVETNHHVISFHKRIGNPQVGKSVHAEKVAGATVGMIDFCATRADWPAISSNLTTFATMAERTYAKVH